MPLGMSEYWQVDDSNSECGITYLFLKSLESATGSLVEESREEDSVLSAEWLPDIHEENWIWDAVVCVALIILKYSC